VLRRCVWSRNIKNRCSIYIYDISSLRVKLTIEKIWLPLKSTNKIPLCLFQPTKIENITDFKSSHGMFPLVQPYVNI